MHGHLNVKCSIYHYYYYYYYYYYLFIYLFIYLHIMKAYVGGEL